MKTRVVEVYDVLVMSGWVAMQVTHDTHYVWLLVVCTACYCMHDRDLSAHEALAALYLLRHTCGAARSPTAFLSVPVVALGVLSRFKLYLSATVLVRRRTVLLFAVVCLTLLHETADAPWVAVTRLALYIGTTRYAIVHDIDPFDAIAQSMWLLCTPSYALCLVLLQLNDMLALYPLPRRRARTVWTMHGVSSEEV